MNLLEILGIISTLGLLAVFVFIAQFYIRKIIKSRGLVIYGDIENMLEDEALFYIIDNVKKFPEYWNADLDAIKIYAIGKQIPCVAFKADDVPNGIRVLLSGAMNSTLDVISIIISIKYNLWEISFDNGHSKVKVNRVKDKHQFEIGMMASDIGVDTFEHHLQVVLDEIHESQKNSGVKLIDENKSLFVAHINEGKTFDTKMRYQILVPESHSIHENIDIDNILNSIKFFHIYEGHAYEIESKFIEKIGSLYEFDLLNLEPGTIYVGLSVSLDGGKTLLPSSALYGITKNIDGVLPTMDESILAKPKPGSEKFEIWNEETAIKYLGEELTYRTYDVIVKKHYEDEYEDEYLALSRTQEFYSDYHWLKGSKTKEHVKEHLNKIVGQKIKSSEDSKYQPKHHNE